MTGELGGYRTEPELWLWRGRIAPAPAPNRTIRIGDAERDQAVSALGDHFAAGRLTREELDERIDAAMTARVSADLEPLFADLPRAAVVPAGGSPVPVRRIGPPPIAALVPVLLVGLVLATVVLNAPWLVWTFVWLALLTGFWRRRWSPPGPRWRGGPPASWR